jgi:hypothetical protein
VKTFFPKRYRGITLLEILVVLGALSVLAAVIFLRISRPKQMYRTPRIQCVNNLKQVGLSFRVWEGDNGGKYPTELAQTNGGTMELTIGPNAWRHFQVMSNELSTGKVLTCPTDRPGMMATNFAFMNNSNISFFVGVGATETNSDAILAGDHNITNGTPVKNGILELTTNRAAGWTAEMHGRVGNILLSDGSVQQVNIIGLREAAAKTTAFTNRLQMPILTP